MEITEKKFMDVGIFLISMPLTIFLILFMINMPNAFSHCWATCEQDTILQVFGVVLVFLGVLFILCSRQMAQKKLDDKKNTEEEI